MTRYVIIYVVLMTAACAVDVADDPPASEPAEQAPAIYTIDPTAAQAKPIEIPAALQVESNSCVFVYPGTWGCYGNNWCNSFCTQRGDSQYGFQYSCVKKPSHWETVCICCG